MRRHYRSRLCVIISKKKKPHRKLIWRTKEKHIFDFSNIYFNVMKTALEIEGGRKSVQYNSVFSFTHCNAESNKVCFFSCLFSSPWQNERLENEKRCVIFFLILFIWSLNFRLSLYDVTMDNFFFASLFSLLHILGREPWTISWRENVAIIYLKE